jgi:DNA-binding NtrC family response regulator
VAAGIVAVRSVLYTKFEPMATILLVEDDHDIRTAYVYALTRAGFQVSEAGDGAQAIAMVESARPDVVVLDMLMPGLSGLDFLRQTQITSRFPQTKVIAFSNVDSPRVVQDARKLGVVEYVMKVDMTPHQMIDIIKKYLPGPPPTPVASPA